MKAAMAKTGAQLLLKIFASGKFCNPPDLAKPLFRWGAKMPRMVHLLMISPG